MCPALSPPGLEFAPGRSSGHLPSARADPVPSESCLHVCLLGGFTLAWGQTPLLSIAGLPARSLFAYLITYRDRPHTRDLLAGTFWPDLPDLQAHRRLSQALWQIGRVLRPLPCPTPYLLADADTVQFNAAAAYWLDVEEFGRLVDWETGKLANWSEDHSTNPPLYQPTSLPTYQSASLPHLRAAVALYRGDFLAGFYDDWTLAERERLRELYLAALGRLIALCKGEGAYQEALGYARRLVAEDQLDEEGHREVMRLCHLLGRRNEALQQYGRCRAVLEAELGIEPMAATAALCREIAACPATAETSYLPRAPGVRPALALDGSDQMPLVGRDREWTALVGHLERTAGGRGGLVLLEGEAGIGKTRLLQEAARDAGWRGMQVLRGRGRELADAPPYGPLVEALRGVLASLNARRLARLVEADWLQEARLLLPDLSAADTNAAAIPDTSVNGRARSDAGRPPTPRLRPEQAQWRLLEALTRILLALGRIAPHLLILEDLHWADGATLAALIHLAPHLAAGRVLVVASYRDEEARADATVWSALQTLDRIGCDRIELAPLTADETGELICHGLGLTQAAPQFASRLYKETAGNPLFVLETLRALHDEGLLYRNRDGAWSTPWDETTADYTELPLPASVREVIARRLARLGPDEIALLQSAAVAGADFDLALLPHVGDLAEHAALAALDNLVRWRFANEGPNTYRFSHDKMRQVVYEAMAPDERRRLHRQVGEALEARQPQPVATLAYHFAQAQIADKALAYNMQAGDQAAALFANHNAAAYYSAALAALSHLPADPACEYILRLGREAMFARLGNRPAQAADLEALERLVAIESLDTPAHRAQVALRRAAYYETVSDYPHALAAAGQAMEFSQAAGDLRAEYSAHVQLGRLTRQRGELAAAGDHFRQAHDLARLMADAAAIAGALRDWGAVFFELGDYGAALDHYQRGLVACPADVPWTLAALHHGLSSVYHYLADFPAALEHGQLALALRRQTGDRRLEASSLYSLGLIYLDSGDPQAARRAMEQVCAMAHAIGDKRIEGYGYVFLGLTLEYLREFEAARHAYATGLALRREVGLHALAVDALAGLARIATALGEFDQAVAYASEVVAWLEAHGPNGVGDPCLAYQGAYRAFLAAGDRERGETALRAAYALLMTYANSIADPERRRAYLQDIDPGRSICADYAGLGAQRRRVRLPRAGVPTGRPLRPDEWVEVAWTVAADEDEAIADKAGRRQHRLQRLLREAAEQGAAPTVNDLAGALAVSRATIKRDLADLRAAGQTARTRGSRSG